jgi:hypothetical protein
MGGESVRTGRHLARSERLAGVVAAMWSLGFAAVSVWQLVVGPGEGTRFSAYAAGLAVMIAVVLVLKLVGALIAVAAVTRGELGLPARGVALGLWGAAGLLALYAAGSIVIAIGTVGGAVEPSAAWTAAGGVTERSLLYLLFVLVGATAYCVLAIAFHRRHRQPWTVAVAGLVGAPLLLGLLLGVAPAILGMVGLLPS